MSERSKPSLAAEVAFAALIAAVVVWYVWDAASASTRLGNLILIAPAAVLAFVALACVVVGVVRRDQDVADEETSERSDTGEASLERFKPLIYLLVFVLYIASMSMIGFDLATFLFIAVTMLVSRRSGWIEILTVSVIGAAVITYGFKALIPYYQFPSILF